MAGNGFLVLAVDWEKVRDNFSDTEKLLLREAVDGETLCPRGWYVDERSGGTVVVKLKRLLEALDEKES